MASCWGTSLGIAGGIALGRITTSSSESSTVFSSGAGLRMSSLISFFSVAFSASSSSISSRYFSSSSLFSRASR